MKADKFPKVMGLGSVLFGAIFSLVLFTSSPGDGNFVKISFYVSFFVFLLCFVSLLLFFIKKKVTNNEILFSSIRGSVRQGAFFSAFVIGILFFASIDLLTWWDVLLLAFSFILLELYFKSNKVVK